MGPAAPADARPKRLFHKLENIRGNSPAGGLKAYVNLPPEAEGDLPQDRVAGSAALFGLSATSRADGGHGGNGISLVFDITDLARRLIADGDFDPEHLRVKVVAAHEGGDEDPVTVDRVSVLRE
jgi:tyrosinase